jgi:hypothetical protein
MTKLTFILLLFTLLSCTSSKKENQEVKSDSIQINTTPSSPVDSDSSDSEQMGQTVNTISRNRDSIVLSGANPFFNRVQIFREQKRILDYTIKDFEIIGNRSNWFTEHSYRLEYFYILRLFDAPDPDRFLIIKTTDTNTTILGITERSSAEIFGDVDYDGKFEIGGMSGWCGAGDNNCRSIDHYRIFEIADNFPTDTALTNYFKQFLKNK